MIEPKISTLSRDRTVAVVASEGQMGAEALWACSSPDAGQAAGTHIGYVND